jgi:transcriptional regulator with XRE-family HTH domain
MPEISLPETLRRLRLQRELTQEQVADAIGAVVRTYSSWEVGKTQPAAVHVAALAKFFAVTADHLLGLMPHSTPLAPQSWVVDLDVVDKLRKPESTGPIQLSDSERRWAFAIPERHAIMPSTEFQRLREEIETLWQAPSRRRRR